MKRPRSLVLAGLLLFTLAACGKKDPHADHAHAVQGGHVHAAPHDGTLVAIGDHAYNVEFVRDAATGKLTAYILDGHAENFTRINAPSFAVVATVAGAKQTLTLQAVANVATGETVGNSSQFEATAEWLKTTASFDATIPALEIKGTPFTAIDFHYFEKK